MPSSRRADFFIKDNFMEYFISIILVIGIVFFLSFCYAEKVKI